MTLLDNGRLAEHIQAAMTKVLYCWRCKMDIPMLEEHEWEQILPALRLSMRFQQVHGPAHSSSALEQYFEITGFWETNPNALWHHRLSLYGPGCRACGKPLRTPRARYCAACGAFR
jgi:hypothetical protein